MTKEREAYLASQRLSLASRISYLAKNIFSILGT
jgi:hypothetical protein